MPIAITIRTGEGRLQLTKSSFIIVSFKEEIIK